MIRNQKAFTIIEIIIATTVLFIGLLGMLALFPSAIKMAEHSKITTRMTLVGQSKIEELIAIGFDNLSLGTETNVDLDHLIDDIDIRNRFDNTAITISAAEGHESGEARNPLNDNIVLLKIDVEVHYELKPGKDKTETFTTYLSKPGF